MSESVRIVDVVFSERVSSKMPLVAAIGLALAFHIAIAAGALGQRARLDAWAADISAQVHRELTREVAIEPPKPPAAPKAAPPPPPVASDPPVLPPAAAPKAAPERARPVAKPAAAAAVLTAPAAETADLTGATIVSGQARVAPGGVTAQDGTGTTVGGTGEAAKGPTTPVPAPPQPVETKHKLKEPAAEDKSQPVSLDGEDWNCAWPDEADEAQINQQSVTIRAVVRADGTAESVTILQDPGHGFGKAAQACAMRTKFHPALDKTGTPIRDKSPPIRLRFTR